MEKIGLTDKIARNLDAGWLIDQEIEASPLMQKRKDSLSVNLILLKEVEAAKDINMALGVEEMMLRQELALYANSQEQRDSINASIAQVQEAKESLSVVQDSQGYQLTAKTYPAKKKEAGLPLDSFRDFVQSHNARLYNLLKSGMSEPGKDIVRQRKKILGMVKEVYIGMQRKALGIEAPNKSKSRGR